MEIGLSKKEIEDLENKGHIFKSRENEFRFLEPNEPNIIFFEY